MAMIYGDGDGDGDGDGAKTNDRASEAGSRQSPMASADRGELLLRASVAVARNHHKALSRCLAQGLDPNSMCSERCWNKGETLLEAASANDALECFLALRAAGARRTVESAQNFFQPLPFVDTRDILAHLLESGELSPDGEAWPGSGEITCQVWAWMSSSEDASLQVVLAERARRERRDMMSSVAPSVASPATSFRTRLAL